LAGRCTATWRLWLRTSRADAAGAATAAAGLGVGAVTSSTPGLAAAALLGAVTPLRLPHRGKTSQLAWTPRLRRVAAVAAAVQTPVVLLAPLPVAAVAVGAPFVVVDLALLALGPVEERLSRKFLSQARRRLHSVAPTVVAITGSYGKTTTKQYLAHLLQGQKAVVASPASFNNAMGLSRAVNENLVPGTDVFIAEMGTYGRGEIRKLCDLFPPDVSVITAIGEVHLERMKSLDRIAEAKAEITERAGTVVLNVDDSRLATLAERLLSVGKTVVRVSSAADADTTTVDVVLRCAADGSGVTDVAVHGRSVTVRLPASVHPANAAAALGAALAVGADPDLVVSRLATLPSVAHRLEPQPTTTGGWVLDDTYNSNPAGAAEAVRRAAGLARDTGGKVHLVTPGMVELGHVQARRNREFAQEAARAGVATLVVVGRTNRAALSQGADADAAGSSSGPLVVLERPDRQSAVDAVSERTGPGDVVIFENDLPDHYP
jgi:UDP-N-acetylmuramoyl-tripeptide--D-alanyl-D-alanine ligase